MAIYLERMWNIILQSINKQRPKVHVFHLWTETGSISLFGYKQPKISLYKQSLFLLLHVESSILYFRNIPTKPVDFKLNHALKVIASN